jgi:hypothetical protein
MKHERLIKVDDAGKQFYHDVTYLTLPSSGGGTYGAGMALPDTAKQPGVWMAISSQPNPHAGKISPTGIAYPDVIPACAFFSPTNTMDTSIKKQRNNAARRAIQRACEERGENVRQLIEQAINGIREFEAYSRNEVAKAITEKPRKEPKGYDEQMDKEEM